MLNLPGMLGTIADLLVIVIGFGAIIFVHELGHFVAARWAGIRVLTFAVGLGPALVSFRRGIGVRRGSSDAEYQQRLTAEAAGATTIEGHDRARSAISPTEYRLSALPFGGYVRMLGQDDMDPGAVSDAPDSYQNCPPWKRMVVISAGVIANVVTAAILFVVVFMAGLEVEPAKVGTIEPGSPAALATTTTPDGRTVRLEPGDTVVSINDTRPRRFDAILMETATASRGRPISLVVTRAGEPSPLSFSITPEESAATRLLDLGFGPAQSLTIEPGSTDAERDRIREALPSLGLPGVEPGMTLVSIDAETDPRSPGALDAAFDRSGGREVTLVFEGESGERVEVVHAGIPEFQSTNAALRTGGEYPHEHLLGLAGVLMVDPGVSEDVTEQGLKPGDVFARIGAVEFPSLPAGIEEIRSHAGRELDIEVLRPSASGAAERVALTVKVKPNGRVGFLPADTASRSGAVSVPIDAEDAAAAKGIVPSAGAVLTAVGDRPVGSLHDARGALLDATRDAADRGEGATVDITFALPLPESPSATRPWQLSAADVTALHALGWKSPVSTRVFTYEREMMRAEDPAEAIQLGLIETRRVMIKTYLTFARLFEGSVKVEHLKGPVGIAHIGTRVASRGFMWVLFFLALISINLAVINFLPLPIVDGGQFLMILYEQLRGRPVPIPIQNAVTLLGLVLIGGAFVLVTFNDVKSLFGL